MTWPLLLLPVSSVSHSCALSSIHTGLEYLCLISAVVIAHALFPSPHLHIIHSHSPSCMVHKGTASQKSSQGNIRNNTIHPRMDLLCNAASKQISQTFLPTRLPSQSLFYSEILESCLPEFNLNITFLKKHSLDTVSCPLPEQITSPSQEIPI